MSARLPRGCNHFGSVIRIDMSLETDHYFC
jgi:hypothetical protein